MREGFKSNDFTSHSFMYKGIYGFSLLGSGWTFMPITHTHLTGISYNTNVLRHAQAGCIVCNRTVGLLADSQKLLYLLVLAMMKGDVMVGPSVQWFVY